MNSSVQIKSHTSRTAKNKNTHILRNSEAYKNPNIIVLEKNDNAFKKEKEIIQKDILKQEEIRKYELKKINSSIATYRKRIEKAETPGQIEKLEKKLNEYLEKRENLKSGKSLELKETRGRTKEKDFIEFEFSLTKSQDHKNNNQVQKILYSAQEETQNKFKFFKELEVVTNVMHLDQFSLHTHLLCKVPKNKTIDNLLKAETKEQGLENSRSLYKSIQTFFNVTLREKLKALNLSLQEHTTGNKYLSLKKYKESQEQERLKEIKKDSSALDEIKEKMKSFKPKQTPERIERDRLEKIKKEQGIGAYLTAKKEATKEQQTQAKKFGKNK